MLVRYSTHKTFCSVLFLGIFAFATTAGAQDATPGSFGNGDVGTLNAFRAAVRRSDRVIVVPTPKGGTMIDVSSALLSPIVGVVSLLTKKEGQLLRGSILTALDHPTPNPSRIRSLSETSYVLVGKGTSVALLYCGVICNPANVTLAMHPDYIDRKQILFSPQLFWSDPKIDSSAP